MREKAISHKRFTVIGKNIFDKVCDLHDFLADNMEEIKKLGEKKDD